MSDLEESNDSYSVGIWAFIATAILVIIVSAAFMSSTLDRQSGLLDLQSHAEAVQLKVRQNYALTGITSADQMDLSRDFPASYPNGLHLLAEASEETGVTLDTGYTPGSLGHALSLSNFVLTGEARPKLLDLEKQETRIEKRFNELWNAE